MFTTGQKSQRGSCESLELRIAELEGIVHQQEKKIQDDDEATPERVKRRAPLPRPGFGGGMRSASRPKILKKSPVKPTSRRTPRFVKMGRFLAGGFIFFNICKLIYDAMYTGTIAAGTGVTLSVTAVKAALITEFPELGELDSTQLDCISVIKNLFMMQY